MKKSSLSLIFTSLLALSSNAQALELLVINNYQNAGSAEIWKKTKTDEVPEALLSSVTIDSPSSSYANVFPKTFFQEPLFVVCQKDCGNNDSFELSDGEISESDKRRWEIIEQSTVYYHLDQYFKFLDEKIQFRPEQFLKVVTNRELRDQGKILKNNAFFDSQEISLSFLPATKNLLFKMMGGKINRSGFDPSVIAHEASHYIFNHLFPNNVNDEIHGLNEGFADYIANVYLDNPRIGNIMLHGRTLRDASKEVDSANKLKVYGPNMEVHDLGERVAFALWKTRELADDKEDMDRMVLDAVISIGQNPYSSVHDFKEEFLKRVPGFTAESKIPTVNRIWEIVFPAVQKIKDLSFLNLPLSQSAKMGFKIRVTQGEQSQGSHLNFIEMIKLSDKQSAVAMTNESSSDPYWITLDTERNIILGVYQNKTLVTEKDKLQHAKIVGEQAKQSSKIQKEFQERISLFADLAQGKGALSSGYKIKDKVQNAQEFTFNNSTIQGRNLRLNLKRKLLASMLGVPPIEALEVFLAPINAKNLPEIEGMRVIGYKLHLENGTAMELSLDQLAF